ncbi:helix-turn-helix transcriptional regulator [Streptomyces sp. yr375]|uniref:helix-turn-helix transcriptional regulator n=1 Tax=Streptomyces sp. yr375 TaxID=1761906 RepID=UPI003526DA9E
MEAAFGARPRSAREALGMAQEALGEQMGHSGTHLSSVETGRKSPTLRSRAVLTRR